MHFDDEDRTLALIEAEHQRKGPLVCCQEVFKRWLKGPDATWENLIKLLTVCGCESLAEEIKVALGL